MFMKRAVVCYYISLPGLRLGIRQALAFRCRASCSQGQKLRVQTFEVVAPHSSGFRASDVRGFVILSLTWVLK